VREARARGTITMGAEARRLIRTGGVGKGDPLQAARLAGIMGAKRTSELIPLCHPLRLTRVDVRFDERGRPGELGVEARVRTVDKTGVEMEALTAVSVAALTVYDMVKALEKGVTIARVQLVEKRGGKSGHWRR
jgi:cyclic pyranopterin phosphate synthase